MKALIAVMVLLLATSVAAEAGQSSMNDAKNFLSSVNPLILIVAGILLVLASSLAKFIGILLLIVGAVALVVQFLL